MHMSEGQWLNKGEGISECDTHRAVFELRVKSPIRTKTLCGEDTLANSRKVDIREGGYKTVQGGGIHQKGNGNEWLKTLDFQHHATKEN